MRHDYSLAHLTVLSLTPPQVVEVAARAGYRYVGLRLTRVTPTEPLCNPVAASARYSRSGMWVMRRAGVKRE